MIYTAEEAIAELCRIINEITNNIITTHQLDETERSLVIDSSALIISVLSEEVVAANNINEDFLHIIETARLIAPTMIYDPLNTAFIADDGLSVNSSDIGILQEMMRNQAPPGYDNYLNIDPYEHGYYGHRVDLSGTY